MQQPDSSTLLVVLAGIFDLALAGFHVAFWWVFRWPQSLGAVGGVNRGILYVLNLALIALFALIGVLLVLGADEAVTTRLGAGLLWGMTLFWLARAALQAPMFGLRRPLSLVLFAVFVLGALLHGWAALDRS